MKKQRKQYTPEEKVAILRRHLVEGVPISDLCDERGLQPTVFYRWQKICDTTRDGSRIVGKQEIEDLA
jgi:transposase-like protein